jgi:tetratricopeptide (TPR) repeat protein
MNRKMIFLAGLVLASCAAIAQAPYSTDKGSTAGTANQTDKTAQQGSNQQSVTKEAPPKPAGGTKVAPEPKTKEEEAAMKAVIAKANDPAAMQAAADEFSTKFPDSNVRGMLYRQVMLMYEQQGNADKSYEAGRKSLTFDADDPLTLANCSVYLSSHTHDTDLDRDERLTEAKKMANDALANIDQLRLNAQSSAEEKAKIKEFVRGQAYNALAVSAQAQKDWPTAEANYAKAIEASPDPATMLRLGFSQRMQMKLEPALATFTKTIEAAKASQADVVMQIATQQKESVEKQIAKQKAAPAAAAPAATSAAPATPTTPKQ